MKLHTPMRQLAMADGHHRARRRAGEHRQRRGQRLVDRQRVVAHGEKALRDPFEQLVAVMEYATSPAVHRTRRGADFAAVRKHQPLVPEADSEHRQLGLRQRAAREAEVARAIGPSGAG
jgi:hypothetical protein